MQPNPYEASAARDDRPIGGASWSRVLWHSVAAGVGPFFVVSAYLLYIEWFGFDPPIVHPTIAFAGAVLVAVVGLATMPVNVLLRVLLILAWVPLLSVMLFYYCFIFIGAVFGRWL